MPKITKLVTEGFEIRIHICVNPESIHNSSPFCSKRIMTSLEYKE